MPSRAGAKMAARRLPPVTIFLAAFVCLLCHAAALSSPSPLTGYHFGATAAVKKVTASDLRSNGPKSYVPDGLTEDQYMQIKNAELAEQQKLNFGMWGPRFKPVNGDPDSNWFNLPSLWTGGFTANKNAMQKTGSDKDSLGTRGIATLRRYGLACLMLLLSTQLLTKSLSAKKTVSSKWIVVSIALSLAALKPLNILAAIAGRRRFGWLNRNGTTKLAGVMAALMAVLAVVLRCL